MENQNKPAFSVALKDNGNALHKDAMGLTKREYFAAMAMQGIVSNQEFLKNLNAEPDLVVTGILEIADKLLARLSNGEGQ
jgi:hypothetical protein